MPRFRVLVNYEMSGWVEVDVATEGEAITTVQEMVDNGLGPLNAELLQDSANVLTPAEELCPDKEATRSFYHVIGSIGNCLTCGGA